MKARWIMVCATLGVAAAAVSGAGSAEAKSGYLVERPSVQTKLMLRGSNGYKISIRNFGHRFVQLSASKGDAIAAYAVQGHATRHGVYANFGKFGKVALRFKGSRRPLRKQARPLLRCKGRPAIREVGTFRGTLRFRGEQGFTAVSTRAARGTVVRSFRRVCKRPPWLRANLSSRFGRRQAAKPSLTVFALASRTKARTILVEKVAGELPGRTGRDGFFLGIDLVFLLEQRGRIWINRAAFLEGHRRDMEIGDSRVEPTSATIAPQRPFSGTAAYAKPPGAAATLTGSLAVSLPGADRVPLTGPGFKSALCRTFKEKLLDRCMREVADELGPKLGAGVFAGPAQGSGSQSQLLWDDRLSWSR
jgi:hypothetical protein